MGAGVDRGRGGRAMQRMNVEAEAWGRKTACVGTARR